eukprot:1149315-Pelagomonas_calceolata.AAC.2
MVDYTVPDVIHSMADFYVKHRTPFVMGTTDSFLCQGHPVYPDLEWRTGSFSSLVCCSLFNAVAP